MKMAKLAVAYGINHDVHLVDEACAQDKRQISCHSQEKASQISKETHKFGMELPKIVCEAFSLYDNTFWEDTTTKKCTILEGQLGF